MIYFEVGITELVDGDKVYKLGCYTVSRSWGEPIFKTSNRVDAVKMAKDLAIAEGCQVTVCPGTYRDASITTRSGMSLTVDPQTMKIPSP